MVLDVTVGWRHDFQGHPPRVVEILAPEQTAVERKGSLRNLQSLGGDAGYVDQRVIWLVGPSFYDLVYGHGNVGRPVAGL